MIKILNGDCRDVLKTLPDCSVHCCVTSPPYYGLRDYGCAGQIGLESTPDAYVAELVAVFREVKRVLRDDGTLWLNLGDSYAGSWGNAGGQNRGKGTQRPITVGSVVTDQSERNGCFVPPAKYGFSDIGVKPKDLIGIPWRVAFALQSDGWYLRQDIIWHKPNPMPESVKDRCTKSHEYIFLLTKSAKYYYDAEAVKEEANYDGRHDTVMKGSDKYADGFVPNQQPHTFHQRGHERWQWENGIAYRNRRSVWTITTKPYKEAHFATFPPDLIRPCIRAGCPAGGTVLDPFGGSGTTGEVAASEGRKAILIELNPEYVKLAQGRGGLFCASNPRCAE